MQIGSTIKDLHLLFWISTNIGKKMFYEDLSLILNFNNYGMLPKCIYPLDLGLSAINTN